MSRTVPLPAQSETRPRGPNGRRLDNFAGIHRARSSPVVAFGGGEGGTSVPVRARPLVPDGTGGRPLPEPATRPSRRARATHDRRLPRRRRRARRLPDRASADAAPGGRTSPRSGGNTPSSCVSTTRPSALTNGGAGGPASPPPMSSDLSRRRGCPGTHWPSAAAGGRPARASWVTRDGRNQLVRASSVSTLPATGVTAPAGSSRASNAPVMAASWSTCSGVRASKTCSRTVAT